MRSLFEQIWGIIMETAKWILEFIGRFILIPINYIFPTITSKIIAGIVIFIIAIIIIIRRLRK